MPTVSKGAAGASNTLTAQWERDVESRVTDLHGEEGKFTKFLSMTSDGDVTSTVGEWVVTEMLPITTTVRTTPTNPTTDLVINVTDAKIFGPNDICQHEDGETCRVTDVDDDATPTITLESRSRGATAAASWASGDVLTNLGSAYDDGDDLETARITQDVIYENPVQLYWERVEFDGTFLAVNEKKGIYGGDYVQRKRKQKMTQMLQQMDVNAIDGEAAETDGVGTGTVRTLGGIREHIAAANTATIATLNQAALEGYTAARPDLVGGMEDILVLCSYAGAVGLNSYSTSRIQATPGGKTMGYDLKEYITPIGKMLVMPHYNFNRSTPMKGTFLFIRRDGLVKKVLRPLKMYGDVNVGTRDVRTDMYRGQHTFAWGHPSHSGEINGVTAYA